jgi:hypothetical protein
MQAPGEGVRIQLLGHVGAAVRHNARDVNVMSNTPNRNAAGPVCVPQNPAMETSLMRTRRRTFEPYMVPHQRAFVWAQKLTAYRSAGPITQAKAGVESVQHWLSKIAVL